MGIEIFFLQKMDLGVREDFLVNGHSAPNIGGDEQQNNCKTSSHSSSSIEMQPDAPKDSRHRRCVLNGRGGFPAWRWGE